MTATMTTSLTTADRCDRCGARAYIRVTMLGGSELLFCAHHGHAHEDALREKAADFIDESSTLVETPHHARDGER